MKHLCCAGLDPAKVLLDTRFYRDIINKGNKVGLRAGQILMSSAACHFACCTHWSVQKTCQSALGSGGLH